MATVPCDQLKIFKLPPILNSQGFGVPHQLASRLHQDTA